MPSYDDVYGRVLAVISEALIIEEDDIWPTSTLQGDLGAESIDFLDVLFRLEREFGIKIPHNQLFPASIFQSDSDVVQNGRVTKKGLEEMREKMPFADFSKFEKNPSLSNFSDLFTVEMMAKYVHGRIQGRW